MALILSAATGNFNAGATWVGGIVPGAADEARASTTHTITITANVTCTELSNDGTGIFTLNSGVTLTANVTSKSTTVTRNCLQFTAASPATATIVGNCTGGTVGGATCVANTNTGTINITGNVTGGTSAVAFAQGAVNLSAGTIAVTGNLTGGSGSSSYAAQNVSTGTITVTGNVTGGSGSSSIGAQNSVAGTITVIGNVTGGSGSTAYGANNVSTGTITVTGIATGGSTNGAEGARNLLGGVLSVGRAKGNDFGTGSTGIVAGLGVSSGQTSVTRVKEIEYGSRGMSPTSGPIYLDPDLTNVAILVNYPSGTGSKTLSDPNNTAGLSPAATDVRNGVVYNYGVNTGSAYIPSAGSVAFGVPVDATTGTATLTAQNVRDAIGLATANLDTQLAAIPTAAGNASAVRTELASELAQVTEIHAIHGLDIANALTVTPTLRSAGAITQAITGDGTTSTIVTRV